MFWENPTSTFLNDHDQAYRYAISHDTHACVLLELTLHKYPCHVPRVFDVVTAFYFPLHSGLKRVEISSYGQNLSSWTFHGSEFRCPPTPLNVILDQCRSVPCLFLDWEHILAMARDNTTSSRIGHNFEKEININGITYRRFEPFSPCFPLRAACWGDLRLRGDSDGELNFIVEGVISTSLHQCYDWQFQQESAEFEDTKTECMCRDGIVGVKNLPTWALSDLAALVRDSVNLIDGTSSEMVIRQSSMPVMEHEF